MNKEPVEFYSEGREAWKKGKVGWFIRKRGLFLSAVFFLLTTGTPWYLKSDIFSIPVNISFTPKAIISAIVIAASALIFFGLKYLRFRTTRSLDVKFMLHDFEHALRDHQTDFFALEERDRLDKTLKGGGEQFHFKELHDFKMNELLNSIGDRTRDYFRRLCKDLTIEIAIRLAEEKTPGGEVEYFTRARTSGMNNARKQYSEPISMDEGIPKFFLVKSGGKGQRCRGVLNYNDIPKAIEIGAFKKTKNEELFPGEIKTLLVAPLNAWSGSAQTTIGIMYIISRNYNIFSEIHTDSALFVADMVAMSIAFAVSVRDKIENRGKENGQKKIGVGQKA